MPVQRLLTADGVHASAIRCEDRTAITRQNWPDTDERRTKVIRERDEITRRVNDGTYRPATLVDGAWR